MFQMIESFYSNFSLYHSYKRKAKLHGSMMLLFFMGVLVGTLLSKFLGLHSIWGAGVVLFVVFVKLLYADRTYEKDRLY